MIMNKLNNNFLHIKNTGLNKHEGYIRITKDILEKYYPQPKKLFNIDNDTAYWPEDAEDWIWWKSEADKWAEEYAKSYKVKMSPKDFLDLTTKGGADSLKVGDDLGLGKLRDLDVDEFNKETYQNIFLQIAFRDASSPKKAQVTGHEGRHRMFALMKAGVKSVDVELICDVWDTEYNKYKPFKLDSIELIGQFNPNVTVQVYNPIPMSWKKHKEIRPNLKDEKLEEKIVKVGNKYQVQSEKGKNLGTYSTKKEAEDRLKQVEYFKHINEDLNISHLENLRTLGEKWCYLMFSYLDIAYGIELRTIRNTLYIDNDKNERLCAITFLDNGKVSFLTHDGEKTFNSLEEFFESNPKYLPKIDIEQVYTYLKNVLLLQDPDTARKVLKEALDSNTPYMLRKDGALLPCGEAHPYIKYYFEWSDEKNIEELLKHPESLEWYYNNTLDNNVKQLIDKFKSEKDVDTFNKLNDLLNNEFCRVRTSNMKYKYGGDNGEIYFRISSTGFNWFDLIWKVVLDNKDYITNVTILKDQQTFGKQFDYYEHKGKKLKHIPIADFLTLSGNPIIEKLVHVPESKYTYGYDAQVFKSTSEAVNYLKTLHGPRSAVRILMNESEPIYVMADVYEVVHANLADYVEEYLGDDSREYEKIVFSPVEDTRFDELDATSDYYEYMYEWYDYIIFSRDDISNSELVKSLGEPNHIKQIYQDDLEESLSENKIEEFIYKEWSDNLSSKPVYGPTYITRDGKFIDIIGIAEDMGEDNFPEDFPCHGALQTILAQKGLCNSGGRYDDGSPILRDLGYIRLNDIERDNNYIELSEQRPTQAQYEALEKWIDENQRHWKSLAVCTPMMIDYKDYDYKETTTDEIIAKIKRWYTTGKLVESLLLEKTRAQLISKSKQGDNYSAKNQKLGKNRWERRVHSRIATTVADYNNIDMNAFWKGDILQFGVKVQGETDNYVVTVIFENILERIRREIEYNKNKLEFKCILRSLLQAFNSEDVYIACDCPDFIYGGFNYWGAQEHYNSDPKYGIAMDTPVIKNPNDSKGAGCKHINLVLSNLNWMMKIASVINNYIWYCKDNMELNYAQYIFPKLYGMDYDKAIQMTLFDTDDLETDPELINLSNALGRRRTQYKKPPEQSVNPRFERPKVERENPRQVKLDFDEPETEEPVQENPEEGEPE